MKNLIVLILLFPSLVFASDVTLRWDYNLPTADLAGFRLYQSTVSGSYSSFVLEIPATELTGQVSDIVDGTYYWVVTAYDQSGNESGNSNEVSLTLVSGIPGEPVNLRIIIINESP